jgi:hypothetical protein
MSLQKQIPDFATAIGTLNKETGTITISTAWYQFLMRQYLDTIGSGLGTAEADLLASSDIELLNSLGAHGYIGTATATFTATNKPGSNGSPVTWLPIDVDGIIRYIPCFS